MAEARQQEDQAAVRAIVERSGTSFYWAMRLLPAHKRAALYAVYAFCREVDDIADGTDTPGDKQQALATWRDRLAAIYHGQADDALTRSLVGAVAQFHLRQADFDAVIDGMAMDADGPIIAPTRETLDLYCDRVASAVGRLCVCIFGEPGSNGMAVANHLGRALQLTNILRDVAEDANLGRLYLAEEDLADAGVQSRSPQMVLQDPHLADACRIIGSRAAAAFAAADAAIAQCDPSAMRPARIMRDVYRPTLATLARYGWQPPTGPEVGLKRARRTAWKLWVAATRSIG